MMNIFNVRKGQLVYFNNELHQVYSVKPFFRQSVHLIRLRDFKQELTTARTISLHRPQDLDSFTFNRNVYTLDKERMAEVGDRVMVIYPSPDYLDHHYLNAIETVATIESNGIISTEENGIKHKEYWVMVPDVLEGARNIDLYDKSIAPEEDATFSDDIASEVEKPRIGDIYEHITRSPSSTLMVIGIQGENIYLSGGYKVKKKDLGNQDNWRYKNHVSEELH